jgi:2-dehydropantoate 2-reductase
MSTNNNQTWYILGAGAIGGLWAHVLQQWGYKVVILCRNEEQHILLQQQGLKVTDDEAVRTSQPASLFPGQANNQLQGSIQYLLVCTKTYATLSALQEWQSLLHPQVNITLLQNGMGTAQQVQAKFPQANIYCATTTDGAWRQSPWHITRAGHGETLIGAYSHHLSRKDAPEFVQRLLRQSDSHNEDLTIQWHPDILTPLWHKLAINSVINGLTAIYELTNGELIDHPQARPRLEHLSRETEDVMSRCHIIPISRGLLKQALRVAQQTATNKSSTLQDCMAGRPTEIDAINGFVIQQGGNLHLPCAAHKQLVEDLRLKYPSA